MTRKNYWKVWMGPSHLGQRRVKDRRPGKNKLARLGAVRRLGHDPQEVRSPEAAFPVEMGSPPPGDEKGSQCPKHTFQKTCWLLCSDVGRPGRRPKSQHLDIINLSARGHLQDLPLQSSPESLRPREGMCLAQGHAGSRSFAWKTFYNRQ